MMSYILHDVIGHMTTWHRRFSVHPQ